MATNSVTSTPVSNTTRMKQRTGFTLIELLVVMAIIAVLLTLAVPRYFGSLSRAREAVLKEDLFQMRDALGKYYGDKGKYPDTLQTLTAENYLRGIPVDPITDSASTWVSVPSPDPDKSGVFDVKSGAQGSGSDGTAYSSW